MADRRTNFANRYREMPDNCAIKFSPKEIPTTILIWNGSTLVRSFSTLDQNSIQFYLKEGEDYRFEFIFIKSGNKDTLEIEVETPHEDSPFADFGKINSGISGRFSTYVEV